VTLYAAWFRTAQFLEKHCQAAVGLCLLIYTDDLRRAERWLSSDLAENLKHLNIGLHSAYTNKRKTVFLRRKIVETAITYKDDDEELQHENAEFGEKSSRNKFALIHPSINRKKR